MTPILHPDSINAIVYADHGAPRDVLGPHAHDATSTVVRAFRPGARSIEIVLADDRQIPMTQIHDDGLFEVVVEQPVATLKYRLKIIWEDDNYSVIEDSYRFEPLLTDQDVYLHGEGRWFYAYEKLGAHMRTVDGVRGVNFAVWAPNARRVSVVGSFNGWDERIHPMIMRGISGIWELFIPGLQSEVMYRFHIRSNHMGYEAEKIDPYEFFAELRPNTSSIVYDIDSYQWQDDAWMTQRGETNLLNQPVAVYEVHLGSWKRNENGDWLTYRELADQLVPYAKEMGFTHIELMPVAEHPLDISWGYQVTGYFAPTSRFGKPDDFMYFVDTCHQHGIGVIVDWVPAHFPKDGHALSYFDGTHLYTHSDPRQGEHPDWGTYIFNYSRNEVRNFLISNALFWLKMYHIDGLRVDAVSSMIYLDFSRESGQWLPNIHGGNENLEALRFMRDLNEVLHAEAPGAVTIAEESTSWPMVSRPTYLGGLGFTMKWNMGWMHDSLNFMNLNPLYRRYHHNELTFSMMYAFNENFVLALSHDEVVHGKGSLINKMPGDWWQQFASLRLLFGYQYTHPGKKLNFMGADIAQFKEWNSDLSLDWHLMDLPTHQALNKWMRDLNHFYQAQPALYQQDFEPGGFQWVEANDSANSVLSYIRYATDRSDFVVVVANFTPVPRYDYRIGVPANGFYREMLNSDSQIYGGGNIGNQGGRQSTAIAWQNSQYSVDVNVPPLGIVILKLDADKTV